MQSWRQPSNNGNTSLDHAAKYHRSSAALYDASCTWSGVLPPRSHRFITYSPKVFLGGIPWDISEQTLMQILKPFGQIRIEWPGKEQNAAQPKGYVYVIFESEKQVKALLQACSIQDTFSVSSSSESTGSTQSLSVSGNTNGNYYYKISSKRIKEKEVEVIPWIIGDSNYIKSTNQKLDSTKTVFVGALHGKLTAEALAKIMNDLFDGVVYAGKFLISHKINRSLNSFLQELTPTNTNIRSVLGESRSTTRDLTCALWLLPSSKSRRRSSRRKFRSIRTWKTPCARCAVFNTDHITVASFRASGKFRIG